LAQDEKPFSGSTLKKFMPGCGSGKRKLQRSIMQMLELLPVPGREERVYGHL